MMGIKEKDEDNFEIKMVNKIVEPLRL